VAIASKNVRFVAIRLTLKRVQTHHDRTCKGETLHLSLLSFCFIFHWNHIAQNYHIIYEKLTKILLPFRPRMHRIAFFDSLEKCCKKIRQAIDEKRNIYEPYERERSWWKCKLTIFTLHFTAIPPEFRRINYTKNYNVRQTCWKRLTVCLAISSARVERRRSGVSNTRPAKLFCAARGHVHELKNIWDKNYLYYPFH